MNWFSISVVLGKICWKESDANDRKIHKGVARKQSTKAGTSIKNPLAKYTIPVDPLRYFIKLSIVLMILKAYLPLYKCKIDADTKKSSTEFNSNI